MRSFPNYQGMDCGKFINKIPHIVRKTRGRCRQAELAKRTREPKQKCGFRE